MKVCLTDKDGNIIDSYNDPNYSLFVNKNGYTEIHKKLSDHEIEEWQKKDISDVYFKKLNNYGIEITGHWSSYSCNQYKTPKYSNIISEKVWNSIKDMTIEDFCGNKGRRAYGIGMKRHCRIIENIEFEENHPGVRANN